MGRALSGCKDTFDWLFAETIGAAFDHLSRIFLQPNYTSSFRMSGVELGLSIVGVVAAVNVAIR